MSNDLIFFQEVTTRAPPFSKQKHCDNFEHSFDFNLWY